MHSNQISFMPSWIGLLFLVFLGLLLLGAFALFIYSIVAKKYWLTILMISLPVGLVAVLVVLYANVSVSPRATSNGQLFPEEVSDISIPDIAWSDDLPPTADIYPSIPLCGRPLAFQIAEAIRRETRFEQKFAVTFLKEKRPGDRDQWKPPKDFVADFQKEFVKQFPGSTVGEPIKLAAQQAEAEPTNEGLQLLEIKLSFKPPESISIDSHDQQVAGAISARWTKPDGARAVASIDFIDKPWVIDPDKYIAKNYTKQLIVGFSQRLARSPAEATTMASQDAGRRGRDAPSQIAPNQIVDRFAQKITLPYGELWQESVLVDQNIPPSDAGMASLPASSPLAADHHEHVHTRLKRATSRWVSKGFTPLNGLILTTMGLIAIGWISNLLTQGYYRHNIYHTLITGVAVVVGLLVLTLFVS